MGDFNGDGKLDLIIAYSGVSAAISLTPPGVLFLAGNGDGTFAAPVKLSVSTICCFVADLTNNNKLDIVGNGTVSLGNGDGTFTQQPLGIPGTLYAIGDLNGDGIPDLVIGNSVYAGIGNGTFGTIPFFSASTTAVSAASIGDVNGDGHPDLIFSYAGTVAVFLGDGTGNFIGDINSYSCDPDSNNGAASSVGTLARLNNQAPALPGDNTLDFACVNNGSVTSPLNQHNPAPTAPAKAASSTSLAVSQTPVAPSVKVSVSASVIGLGPTGNMAFTSNGAAIGTAPIVNGTATLSVTFPASGTFTLLASYAGDSNNQPSSSTAASITVAKVASTTTLSASASTAAPAQQLTFAATITGFNPTGNVTFTSGTTTLGTAVVTSGAATLAYAFPTAGSFPVTAAYAGDANNLASTSNSVTVSVIAPDYTVSASPSTATITAGQSATATLTVTPVGGFSGTVTFSCGILPAGASCTFAPATVTPASGAASTSTLTVTTNGPLHCHVERSRSSAASNRLRRRYASGLLSAPKTPSELASGSHRSVGAAVDRPLLPFWLRRFLQSTYSLSCRNPNRRPNHQRNRGRLFSQPHPCHHLPGYRPMNPQEVLAGLPKSQLRVPRSFRIPNRIPRRRAFPK